VCKNIIFDRGREKNIFEKFFSENGDVSTIRQAALEDGEFEYVAAETKRLGR